MLTRKDFLIQTATAAAGLAFYRPSILRKTSVVIIGAGLSGLAAAYKLRQLGHDCTVLESSSRIGGRVFSHQIDPGLVVELGGEWVGFSHERMQELCGEFKLELQNNQFDTHLIYRGEYAPSGKWDFSDEWKHKLKTILENFGEMPEEEQIRLDQYDWWRYLVENGCEGRDLNIRELLDSTDFGESIRHVSAYAALAEYSGGSEKNEMDLKIRGGNTMLPNALADAVGRDRIHLRKRVHRVHQDDSGVRVYTEDGAEYQADKLICAIPTFAMSRINWEPGLPETKKSAIQALQYARINKHAMLFSSRFWKDERFDLISDELPHYLYHGTKNQISDKGVLISYSIGEKAAVIAAQSNEKRKRDADNMLSPFFGAVAPLMEKQDNYYWGDDQNTRGAYALYGPGQWYQLQPALHEPFLNTHFAGEHIAEYQGFMEGAVQSGEEAVSQFI